MSVKKGKKWIGVYACDVKLCNSNKNRWPRTTWIDKDEYKKSLMVNEESNYSKMHAVWFHLYEILKLAICKNKNKISNSLPIAHYLLLI